MGVPDAEPTDAERQATAPDAEPTAADFERAGLLEDLEGAAREARLGLLTELAAGGMPLEELREAVLAGRLALLPVERALAGDGSRYTADEVAAKAGVDLEILLRSRAALGVPETDPGSRTLTDEDVEAARHLGQFLAAGLPEDGVLQVARTIGIATAQVAQANRELIVRNLIGADDDEAETARRLAFAASSLTPLVGPILSYGLRIHLISQISQDVIEAAGLPGGGVGAGSEMAVCFADLVGFTKLGERLDLERLGSVADRLGELALGAAGGSVRLVKQIGDAVMLVSSRPADLAEAALKLSETAAAEGEGFPDLRVGIDYGAVVGRSGDFYGQSVNRASRITAAARPGSVLVSGEMRDAIEGGEDADAARRGREGGSDGERFDYSFAGERSLKGISGKVRLFRMRRISP